MEQRVPVHINYSQIAMDAARAQIPLPDKARDRYVHYNQGDAMVYADLWLMSQCQHFIIAS